MNLRTKSEMLFPGREKSGLVTPNSTDCAIPKGFGGPWPQNGKAQAGDGYCCAASSGVLLQTISRRFLAMGPRPHRQGSTRSWPWSPGPCMAGAMILIMPFPSGEGARDPGPLAVTPCWTLAMPHHRFPCSRSDEEGLVGSLEPSRACCLPGGGPVGMVSGTCHFGAGTGFPGPEGRGEEPKGGAGNQTHRLGSAFRTGFCRALGF